jgi:hypothetical protein
VRAQDVDTVLRTLFPGVRYVGDKFPSYVFNLSMLAGQECIRTVVIYRDGRDVVASFLQKVRKDWKRLPVVGQFDTPTKIALRWCRAIEEMQRHGDRLHAIQYETLVQNPIDELARLAAFLEIDPAGFRYDLVSPARVARFRETLTDDELAAVMNVAGPTLEKLGYA